MNTIADNFELIFGTANNIQALRRKVLDLAIRGKLVVNITDLQKSASINSTCSYDAAKVEPENINDDQFEIPLHWSMVSSKEVFELVSGRDEPIVDCNDLGIGIPYAMGASNINLNGEFVPERWIEKPKVISRIGDIIITVKGTIGKIYVNSLGDINLSRQTMAIRPKQPEMLDYLTIWVKTIISTLSSRAIGIIPGVSREDILSEKIPLPPISEQYQIVAKVKFLMSEIDKLEAALKKKEQLLEMLPKSVVDAIGNCQSEEELKQKLEFLIDNYEHIFQTPGAMQELRNVILQLAIEGKLEKQNPDDISANQFVNEISKHREILEKDGTLQKSTRNSLTDTFKPAFSIPANWCWARFGDIAYNYDSKRIPLSKDVRKNVEKVFDYYGASGVIDKVENYIFDRPLLLIGEDGANLINRSTPIAFIATGKYWVNNHAHVLDFINFDLMEYLMYFFNAIDLRPYVTGTAQPKMNQENMNSILVSIPSKAEIPRINAKIKILLSFVDSLEEKIQRRFDVVEKMASAS